MAETAYICIVSATYTTFMTIKLVGREKDRKFFARFF